MSLTQGEASYSIDALGTPQGGDRESLSEGAFPELPIELLQLIALEVLNDEESKPKERTDNLRNFASCAKLTRHAVRGILFSRVRLGTTYRDICPTFTKSLRNPSAWPTYSCIKTISMPNLSFFPADLCRGRMAKYSQQTKRMSPWTRLRVNIQDEMTMASWQYANVFAETICGFRIDRTWDEPTEVTITYENHSHHSFIETILTVRPTDGASRNIDDAISTNVHSTKSDKGTENHPRPSCQQRCVNSSNFSGIGNCDKADIERTTKEPFTRIANHRVRMCCDTMQSLLSTEYRPVVGSKRARQLLQDQIRATFPPQARLFDIVDVEVIRRNPSRKNGRFYSNDSLDHLFSEVVTFIQDIQQQNPNVSLTISEADGNDCYT